MKYMRVQPMLKPVMIGFSDATDLTSDAVYERVLHAVIDTIRENLRVDGDHHVALKWSVPRIAPGAIPGIDIDLTKEGR